MPAFSSVTASIYPWDVVGDPAAADQAAQLGIDRVNLPAVYHAVRATTMRHPDHRVVETTRTGMFTPFDRELWGANDLRAADGSAWFGSEDLFATARESLVAAGLEVDAWVVLMHADGTEEPDDGESSRFHNAFGDVYDFALCPNARGVQEYALKTVATVAKNSGVSGILLEACGSYGFTHLSEHDKTDGSGVTEVDRALLSLCFCAGCREKLRAVDLDDQEIRRVVIEAIGHTPSLPVETDSRPLTAALRDIFGASLDALISVREDTNASLRNAAISEARKNGIERISFQASADPWATGFSAAVLDSTPDIQVAVIDSTGPHSRAAARLAEMNEVFAPSAARPALGAFTSIDAISTRDQFAERWGAFAAAGADELHLYHAGLASSKALIEAGAALALLAS
jgi:hypothetical protein